MTSFNPSNLLKSISLYSWPFKILLALFFIRLVSIFIMGPMPQDAYYHFYGANLALSYFDHPPMIAYILRTFTEIFGKKVFVLKLADTIITFCTIISFYNLARLFLSRHVAQKALLLLLSTFMVTMLSLISTPDVPLILFWSLSLIAVHQAVFADKKMYWLLAGLLMGLSFDSKFTGVFLPAGTVLFLLASKDHRKQLISPWFWAAIAIFFITISPVIIWNVQNDFASFKFQSTSRIESMSGFTLNPIYFLGVISHQSAVLMPILMFSILLFLYKIVKKYSKRKVSLPADKLFLLCYFVPIFISFLTLSFIAWVKINWMLPGYITGIILVSTLFNAKWMRYQFIFSLCLHIVLMVEVLFYPVPVKSDDTWLGWPELAEKVKELKIENPGAFVFAADDYKTSAELNFFLNDMVYGRNVIGEPALQFDYIGTNLNLLKGRNAIYINSIPNFKTEEKENVFPPKLSTYFDSVTELDPILIKNNHKTVRKFLVFYCTNYHLKGQLAKNKGNRVDAPAIKN